MSLDLIQQTALDEDVRLLNAAMTKEEFFALAEKRKRDSVGSGFLEWGKHRNGVNLVNEGMYIYNASSSIHLGRLVNNQSGISRTEEPLALVNGVQHKLFGTATGDKSLGCEVKFPDAPNGTKTYDSAIGEGVDYMVDVDPKYGDVAPTVNEAVARAFEGDCRNGDGRLGTTHWSGYAGGVVTSVAGKVVATIDTEGAGFIYQSKIYSEGTQIRVRGRVEFSSPTDGDVQVYFGGAGGYIRLARAVDGLIHDIDTIITIGNGSTQAQFEFRPRKVGSTITIHEWSYRPVTNQVITTRKDLVFLETWHEDLATNDLFNPLGNVQYGTSSFDGITGLANNLVSQGYSAFGEWDTVTKGYGKRWSTMTAVEKIKAIQNPDNNIYYDAETKKYIQVKYRIRVVEGLDNAWKNVRWTTKPSSAEKDAYGYVGFNHHNRVKPQAQQITSKDYQSSFGFYPIKHRAYPVTNTIVEGELMSTDVSAQSIMIPICLVQRLNQGAYHPVWNSEGCAKHLDGNDWHNTTVQNNSTLQCFTQKYNNGFIGTTSGRLDQYKYYDAIYAGQVEDLRLNANKQDYNRLLEEGIRKAVAGKTRGKGKVPFIQCIFKGNSVNHGANEDRYRISLSSRFLLDALTTTGGTYIPCTGNAIIDGEVGEVLSYYKDGSDLYIQSNIRRDKSKGYTITLLLGTWLTPEYDSLPWVDIVGTPERIAATFPNGVVGQWVPVIPDGTGKIWQFNRKVNGRPASAYSSDNGASWNISTGFHFDAITNSRPNAVIPSHEVGLYYYEALSNFTAPANNSAVVGQVGDVFTTHSHSEIRGNRLSSSLINKVQTSASSTPWVKTSKINEFAIGDGNRLFLERTYEPKHTPIALCTPQNNSPAVKTLYTLTSKDGLLYMQYHGNELKYKTPVFTEANSSISASYVAGTVYKITSGDHKGRFILCKSNSTVVLDNLYINSEGGMLSATTGAISAAFEVWNGSGWGDDSTIPVINGEGTKTNLNGGIVKTFCHHEMFPIGIADATESLPSTRYINFYAMKYVPHSLVQHYDEVDCIKGYDTEIVESICEITGEPITTEVKVPIMGKELVRKPFYFENNGHIDEAEIDRHTQYVQAVDEYIEGLIEESESKSPQLMI